MELLLVLGAHRLEQLAGRARLLLVDHGDREPDVDQHPVAGPDLVEETDVDGAPDSGYVNLGESVGLVDDLNDLAWNRQAHVSSSQSDVRRRGYSHSSDCCELYHLTL